MERKLDIKTSLNRTTSPAEELEILERVHLSFSSSPEKFEMNLWSRREESHQDKLAFATTSVFPRLWSSDKPHMPCHNLHSWHHSHTVLAFFSLRLAGIATICGVSWWQRTYSTALLDHTTGQELQRSPAEDHPVQEWHGGVVWTVVIKITRYNTVFRSFWVKSWESTHS